MELSFTQLGNVKYGKSSFKGDIPVYIHYSLNGIVPPANIERRTAILYDAKDIVENESIYVNKIVAPWEYSSTSSFAIFIAVASFPTEES